MVFVAHLISCAFMCGVIWIIQVLHYPAFLDIGPDRFASFHRRHTQRISYIVAPVMILELATGFLVWWNNKGDLLLSMNLVTLGLIWISTFALSVPIHDSLAAAMDLQKIGRLVRTNWPRTILWTFRVLLLFWYAYAH